MNGRRGFSQCSGCGEIGKYGSRPKHKGSCLDASKEWDKDCICGHWCGHHMGPGATKDKPDGTTWGCNLEGCRCELNYIEASAMCNTKLRTNANAARLQHSEPQPEVHSIRTTVIQTRHVGALQEKLNRIWLLFPWVRAILILKVVYEFFMHALDIPHSH